ncbi:MAG: HAD hydrolase-like protein [Clostridia bacterium]
MNIGVDIDDTLTDTTTNLLDDFWLPIFKAEGLNFKIISNHNYYFLRYYGSKSKMDELWEKYYDKFNEIIPIKYNASRVIKLLREEGHKIFIVTARSQNSAEIRSKYWLKLRNVEYDGFAAFATNKVKDCKIFGITTFVDDAPSNCMDLSNAGIKTFMMTHKTNLGLELNNVIRVKDWSEFYLRIKDLVKIEKIQNNENNKKIYKSYSQEL